MKKIFLILLVATSKLSLFGQFKTLFPVDTVQWNVVECIPDKWITIKYYSYEDTLIDSKKYYQINRKEIWDYSLKSSSSLYGFVREDTTTGECWFLEPGLSSEDEFLFIDFKLEKGDTFGGLSYLREPEEFIVDSVFYQDGLKVIRFINELNCGDGKIEFIESIGSKIGFSMLEDSSVRDQYAIICKIHNSEVYYSSSSDHYGTCLSLDGTSTKNLEDKLRIQIVPNPNDGNFSILYSTEDKISIEVFNILGKSIHSNAEYESQTNIFIDEPGLYILKCTKNNHFFNRLFIIR